LNNFWEQRHDYRVKEIHRNPSREVQAMVVGGRDLSYSSTVFLRSGIV
jgi:hypothetical protein